MDDAKWLQFFQLMNEIISQPLPANEKGELVSAKAKELDYERALKEFSGYDLYTDGE